MVDHQFFDLFQNMMNNFQYHLQNLIHLTFPSHNLLVAPNDEPQAFYLEI